MKFNYEEMEALSFKGKRFYQTPSGKFYPSITTVLGGTTPPEKADALKNWQASLGMDVAQKKTQEAADRGTSVHLMIERYLKKEPVIQGEKFDSSIITSFNGLKLKLNAIEEVWGQEVALYSDLLEIAGRCDCIGVYKGKECIIDFKTAGRLKGDKDIDDYKLQLTAYAIMHNEIFGTDISDGVILMTSAGGFPQEFRVNLLDYVDKLADRVDKFYVQLEAEIA
jgi:CRISPR/Cas system-associated exonuclease Cas4 (RecB family)